MPLHTLQLTGLNGNNPLAFLAALGTLRTAWQLADAPVYLHWQQQKNGWYPALQGEDDFLSSPEAVSESFATILAEDNPAFSIADNPKLSAADFRNHTKDAVEKWFASAKLEYVSFMTALGNDSIVDENGKNEDTAFRTMSGAGHQHFLQFMRELVPATKKEHMAEALFGPWKYDDEEYGMRWDPKDDRRYALRWHDPSERDKKKDPSRNVRGANRLAIEGLPLYPTMPTAKTLETTGFKGHKANGTFWTWPLWTAPVSFDVCRSLLAHAELLKETPSIAKLKPLGVSVVFRSHRITVGKYRNFTPATTIGE